MAHTLLACDIPLLLLAIGPGDLLRGEQEPALTSSLLLLERTAKSRVNLETLMQSLCYWTPGQAGTVSKSRPRT